MSDFLSGFGFGLALSTRFNYSGLGYGYGFGRYGYYGAPSAGYIQTCYCDFNQPTGLSSYLDNGWAVNAGYRYNPFRFGSFGGYYSPYSYCGMGIGFGMYC